MQDLIRQRLQPGDKIRVNDKARKKHLHGKVGVVKGYTDVLISVDGVDHIIVPTSLDVVDK